MSPEQLDLFDASFFGNSPKPVDVKNEKLRLLSHFSTEDGYFDEHKKPDKACGYLLRAYKYAVHTQPLPTRSR